MTDQLRLELSWHGVKTLDAPKNCYVLPRSDYYIDARALQEYGLKHSGKSGSSPELQAELCEVASETLDLFTDLIIQAVERIPQRRRDKQNPYAEPFHVTFVCAWGQCRSKASCMIVAKELKQLGYNVTVKEV